MSDVSGVCPSDASTRRVLSGLLLRYGRRVRRPVTFAAFLLALSLGGALAHADEPVRAPDPEPAPSSAGAPETKGRGIAVTSKLVDLRLSGYVQADWVLARQSSSDELDPATRQPLNQDRFLLRRGHIRVDAERGYVTSAVEIDANTVAGPALRPVVANVSARWPGRARRGEEAYAVATMGLFKTPFGYELLELDNVRPFLERATGINALFPGGGYDAGLRIKGGYRFFDYVVGVMNGEPVGEKSFPGLDPNRAKDFAYRLGVHAEPRKGIRIEAGFSQITGAGFHPGTAATKDTLVWHDANEDGVVESTEIQVVPGSTATPSQRFRRFALGGDVRASAKLPVVGELVLRGEVVRGANLDRGVEPADPVASGRDLRELGYSLGLVQELTHWGYVGVRYDRYDADADAAEQLGVGQVLVPRVYSTWSLVGAFRYETARLLFEYDHRTNPLGRDPSGATTTLKDDSATLRAEVSW